jgi:hypothetical protein
MLKKLILGLTVLTLTQVAFGQIYVQGAIGKADLAFNDPDAGGLKSNQIGYKSLVGFTSSSGLSYESQVIRYGRHIKANGATSSVTGFGVNIASLGKSGQYLDYRLAAGIGHNTSFDNSSVLTSKLKLTVSAGIAYKVSPRSFIVAEYDLSHGIISQPSAANGSYAVNLVSIGYRATF